MTFSFIQITDHHLTQTDAETVKGFSTRYSMRAVLRHIAQNAGNQADFIFSTGDLVDRPSEPAYAAALQLFDAQNASATIPGPLLISAEGLHDFPLYLLPGNHDDRDLFVRCLFPRSPPVPWMNVAFMHKGIQFICLDWGPQTKAVVLPEMLDFLAGALNSGAPSIILMHYQVILVGARWLDDFIADDVARFWEVVAGRNVLGIFCGHLHITYEQVVNGIPVFGLRSTAFQFAVQEEPLYCLQSPHYRLVTVQENGLETQVIEVPL